MLEAKDTSASALQKKKFFTKIFQAISKKKKRSSQKFCKRSPQKNVFQKIFQAMHEFVTIQKILLSSSRGQANFRGLEASRRRTWPSRPRTRTSKCVLEQWRAVRLLVGEAQFFFTHMFAKKLFETINDKQIIVFIAIKPELPNPWPVDHIWPTKLFCVARKVFLRGWFRHAKASLAFSGK